MNNTFPIPIPDRFPTRISPCSIVEAILEVRFITSEQWTTLPGLLYVQVREKYPAQKELPLAKLPEEVRRKEPVLFYKPLIQFLGQQFLIQLGPRVVSLVAKSSPYPGWAVIEQEMQWLLDRIQAAGFMGEGERLAVRHIDFFEFDIFPQLRLRTMIEDSSFAGNEMSLAAVLKREPLTVRLAVSNGAILEKDNTVRHGSTIDVDAWAGAQDFDLFTTGLDRFREAHQLTKQIFFGLLRPQFLETLKPEYA